MEEHIIIYSSCPACGSGTIQKVLSAKDYLVSSKEFELWQCDQCQLRFTQNIPDEASISTYYRSANYISHTETSKGLVNRLYHFVRTLTLADKRRLILSVTQLKKGSLLDIGAGTGAFIGYMQSHGWEALGIEPDEEAREKAKEIRQVDLLAPDTFSRFSANMFDAVTMWHVLEHVHNLHDYLEQLKKIIRPGGKIFIAVPNYESYDASFYKDYWAAYDVPRHLYHFCPEAMFKLLHKHELKLHATRPMWFDSFYVSLLSEKYKQEKKNSLRGWAVGFISNLKCYIEKEKCSSLIYIVGK
ncbi:MAG: class I SAM-dependent methyltransferase [Bacteroidetes bacterium]|nr:class I SAM-dependent methyltransferase [Bacteroidota bacterium]